MTKKKSVTLGLITFAITLIITAGIVAVYISIITASRKEKAEFVVKSVADTIEAEIDTREFITRVFEIALTGSGGEMSEQEFASISDALFNDYLDVTEISLAPDGIVSYIYPDKAATLLDTNLFEDSMEGVYADYSKMSRVPIIIAPSYLKDGSSAIIIRKPIFLNDGSFWGFASVTVDMEAFLGDINIDGLAYSGYNYRLIGNNAITGENKVIRQALEGVLISPVEAMISTVGGAYWMLGIAPADRWTGTYEVLIGILVALVISALSAMFMYAYMNMKANAKELEVLSYRDSLTNLYNPRSYHEHMEELSTKKLPYGVIFMDLNDFKMVNDTYGHETGDALLNIVAKRLQNSIREKDRAFRIGGDEFVVVIHGTHDKKFYESVIARMRQNVARDVVVGEITLKVSISAGYARCPEDGSKLEDVVKKADDAMYYNKRMLKARRAQGQNKTQVTAEDFK